MAATHIGHALQFVDELWDRSDRLSWLTNDLPVYFSVLTQLHRRVVPAQVLHFRFRAALEQVPPPLKASLIIATVVPFLPPSPLRAACIM